MKTKSNVRTVLKFGGKKIHLRSVLTDEAIFDVTVEGAVVATPADETVDPKVELGVVVVIAPVVCVPNSPVAEAVVVGATDEPRAVPKDKAPKPVVAGAVVAGAVDAPKNKAPKVVVAGAVVVGAVDPPRAVPKD